MKILQFLYKLREIMFIIGELVLLFLATCLTLSLVGMVGILIWVLIRILVHDFPK